MIDERSVVEKSADRILKGTGITVGGMLAGELLSSPANALADDISAWRNKKYIDGEKVVPFMFRDEEALKRVKAERMKRYIPKPGLPKGKAALTGGTIALLAAGVLEAEKANKEKNEFIRSLQKEASENYRNITFD